MKELFFILINIVTAIVWYRFGAKVTRVRYQDICKRASKISCDTQFKMDLKAVVGTFDKLHRWADQPELSKEDIVEGLRCYYEYYEGSEAVNEVNDLLKQPPK